MKSREIRLGDVVLDIENRRLQRCDGSAVELRNKSMDVLLVLAENPGEVISKDGLLNRVWGETFAAEEGLVQCIADIRRALNDEDKTIVETIPRSGYRLNGTVQAARHRWFIPAAVLMLAIAVIGVWWLVFDIQTPVGSDIKVVAVLPLDDLSTADNKGYLSDALSEGIITELARFPHFRVVARNSSFQFRGTPTDIRKIGKVLGADYVVEGSQQYDGERLRVTIQLIDTETGTHLLSEKLDRKIEDLFAIQDQIVGQVASKVGGSILTHLPTKHSKNEVSTLLRSLQARKLMRHFSRENWEKALALEETNIRTDPESPWGYLGKSLMLRNAVFLGWIKRPRDEILDESLDLARKALTIAPKNYMSHFAAARVLATRTEYAKSLLHYETSAKLNPSDPLVLLGMSVPLLNVGRAEHAITILLKARSMDPSHSDWSLWLLGRAYWQNQECKKGLEAMLAMASPHFSSQTMLAANYVCVGDLGKAKKVMEAYMEKKPDHTISAEAERVHREWEDDEMSTRWLEAMRVSGMPE